MKILLNSMTKMVMKLHRKLARSSQVMAKCIEMLGQKMMLIRLKDMIKMDMRSHRKRLKNLLKMRKINQRKRSKIKMLMRSPMSQEMEVAQKRKMSKINSKNKMPPN